MKKIALGVAVLVVVSAVALAAKNQFDDNGIPVKVATAEVGSITTLVSATGIVINREELTINSPNLAFLVHLSATEGASVTKGQVLARFDDREHRSQVEKARVAVRIAQQNEDDARRTHMRLQQVYAVGGEARKTVEDAELRVQTLYQERLVAQESLQQALAQRDSFKLIAPIDGTLTARSARVGTWVKAGDPLFRLAPAGVREIEVKLDAGDSAAATMGKAVVATSDAYPGQKWTEKITWVAPATNKEGAANSLNVRVSLSDYAPVLVLGQQVDVKIPTASRDRIVKIPSSAIVTKQGKRFVAVLADARARIVPVETGIEDMKYSEVIQGLSAGQQILLGEGQSLREGAKVKIVAERIPE